MEPFGMNLIRVGISTVLFWAIYLVKPPEKKIQGEDIPRFICCALTGIAINQMLFLKGLSLSYSIHAALLMLTTPILITFIAAWLLKEMINWYKIVGLGLGVCGAVILITARQQTGNGSQVFLGDMLILINAVAYTIYFVIVKPLMLKYNPVQVIRWIFTYGFFMVLPFGYTEFAAINWVTFGAIEILCISLIVFGGYFSSLPF